MHGTACGINPIHPKPYSLTMKQNGDLPRTVPPVRFIISKQQANNQWKQTTLFQKKRVTASNSSHLCSFNDSETEPATVCMIDPW